MATQTSQVSLTPLGVGTRLVPVSTGPLALSKHVTSAASPHLHPCYLSSYRTLGLPYTSCPSQGVSHSARKTSLDLGLGLFQILNLCARPQNTTESSHSSTSSPPVMLVKTQAIKSSAQFCRHQEGGWPTGVYQGRNTDPPRRVCGAVTEPCNRPA